MEKRKLTLIEMNRYTANYDTEKKIKKKTLIILNVSSLTIL